MDSLGQLRQLIALAETGNFRKAGLRLGISHSAVSQTIKRLEAEYGTELFDRTELFPIASSFIAGVMTFLP